MVDAADGSGESPPLAGLREADFAAEYESLSRTFGVGINGSVRECRRRSDGALFAYKVCVCVCVCVYECIDEDERGDEENENHDSVMKHGA
jgi:hypothetical protein